MARPLFLLSNDDGVHAPGIRALAEAVGGIADWIIVAPHVEKSGSGQGISLVSPLRVEKLAANIYAVEGTPADCVMFALNRLMDRRPDFVISGINRGANIGQDTLYSGTVAAAMEGCLHGLPAMAISLQGRRAFEKSDYVHAVQVVRKIFTHRDELAVAHGHVLNVNIPHVPLDQMQGIVVAGLGRRLYDNQITENTDPRGRPYFWIGGGGEDVEKIPNTDCTLLAERFVTISALSPDRTNPVLHETLRNGAATRLSQAVFGRG